MMTTQTVERRISQPAKIFPLLLAPVDDYFRIDDHPDYPMTFISRQTFRGHFDREAFQTALEIALARHPLLTAHIGKSKRGKLCWVDGQGQQPQLDWATDAMPMNCANGGSIDLSREVGLRMWVRESAESTDVASLFHHAATDGNGAHRFLGDLYAAYDYLYAGSVGEIPFDPIDARELRARRNRMGDVAVNGKPRHLIRLGLRQGYDLYCKKICPLAKPTRSNDSRDMPFPWQQTAFFSRNDYKRLTATANRLGVLLNDLLIAEMFHTVIAWNQQHSGSLRGLIRIVIPADLRGKEDFEMPAANMASFAHVSRKASECEDSKALLRDVQREMMAIKNERRATQFMDAVMLLQSAPWTMHLLKKWRKCMSTAVLTNVGDPSRRFRARFRREGGKIVCGNVIMERMDGCSQLRPNTRAAITVNSYGRAFAVTANCDRYLFGEKETAAFLKCYLDRLRPHMEA